MDDWHGLTMEQLRKMEKKNDQELNKVRAFPTDFDWLRHSVGRIVCEVSLLTSRTKGLFIIANVHRFPTASETQQEKEKKLLLRRSSVC